MGKHFPLLGKHFPLMGKTFHLREMRQYSLKIAGDILSLPGWCIREDILPGGPLILTAEPLAISGHSKKTGGPLESGPPYKLLRMI